MESTRIVGNVLLVLSLELLNKVVDHPVIEILSSQMGVTSGGFDLEDSVFDGQNGHIECSSTEVEKSARYVRLCSERTQL